MTHYLRSRHDGIVIGVGTAVADDPGLNCRITGVGGYGQEGLAGQPRPVVIDPTARWEFSDDSKLFQLCREGRGLAPWIITAVENPNSEKQALLERYGGRFISAKMIRTHTGRHQIDWPDLLVTLKSNGLESVMIEGGGQVIKSLLSPSYMSLLDSVIVTIAPTWLGEGGVVVSPARRFDEGNLCQVHVLEIYILARTPAQSVRLLKTMFYFVVWLWQIENRSFHYFICQVMCSLCKRMFHPKCSVDFIRPLQAIRMYQKVCQRMRGRTC